MIALKPDLISLMKLHESIKKVQSKQTENHDKLELLSAAYDQLKKKVKDVRDEQNMTSNATQAPVEVKKDEKSEYLNNSPILILLMMFIIFLN